MKKLLILLSVLVMASSCTWFAFDNEDGYDATISGTFVDSKTGEPVQFAHPNANTFQVIELGWSDKASQNWYIKPNGTYVNKMVFSGSYLMHTLKQNFYPVEEKPFDIKKGENKVDFTVTPYARILDPQISFENGFIVARFKVECSDPSKTTKVDAAFFGFTDRFVSEGYNNFDAQKATSQKSHITADGTTVIELKVDTSKAAKTQFTYKRNHFLRIGVVATGTGVNTAMMYNYSPVYLMPQDFSTATEITDWNE